MLVVVGISSYAAETTWESQPTTAAEYDAVFDYTSYTSTTAPTTWTDTSNNQKVVWSITPTWRKSVYFERGKNGAKWGAADKSGSSRSLSAIEFSTSDIPGTITNVTILSINSNGTANASVSVGGTTFETSKAISSTVKDLSFTGSASGKIVISIPDVASGKYLQIKGLSVTYDPNGGGNPVTAPQITIDKEPVDGVYEYGAKATITGDEGNTFMYTLDGSDPYTSSTAVDYEDAFTLPEGEYTIKAIALDEELNASSVTELPVKVAKTGPVVDMPEIIITGEKSGDDYLIGTTAAISAPNAAAIQYTTDGSDPNNADMVGKQTIELGKLALGETTIKAIALDSELNISKVAEITVKVVKKPAGISWSSDQCKVYIDEEPYSFPTLTNPNELKISYSIPAADAAIATIDKATGEITIVGEGSTTVRATYTSTDDSEFAGSWVQYTLTVAKRPAGESVHATSYMFDFTDEADFRGLASYGMTFFTNGQENNKYETDMDNPVTTIIRKGVTLDFIVPDGISTSYRLYQGSLKKGDALRVYNAKLQFSVPAPGRIKSIVFHKGGSNNWNLTEVSENNGTNPTGWDGDVATWTSAEDESISTIWFNFNGNKHTRFTGITVEYDLQKPAMPYVVSETADAIVVECDDWCELHYTKKPESAAKAPSRAQLNDGTIEDTDEWYNHGSYQITIDKNNTVHQDRGYSFIANHAETGLKSDALNLYVGSDGTLTGVEGISAEADADAPVEFYDLQGRMVANPQGGIFIRRQGSKVTKVAL
jgi:hypothetical protein